MGLSIPIIAILSDAWVKSRKMTLDNDHLRHQAEVIEGLKANLQQLEQENQQLKDRLLNVETIVTGPEWDNLLISAKAGEDDVTEKTRDIARKIQGK